MNTMLDVIKQNFKLKRLVHCPFHYNSLNEYEDVAYVSHYKSFFGPEVYATKRFYQEVFEWTTSDGMNHRVAIVPEIIYSNPPRCNEQKMLDDLLGYIRETLNNNVTQRLRYI
jgi:hypothetical protein